ncbi:MAG TPA: hypothetical protein VLF94_02165 [Chlamydiales bacterium]|nr:hypothetical protein [Chlamydiales bacterium]
MIQLILLLLPIFFFGVSPPPHRDRSDPFVSGDGFRAYADYVYDEVDTSLNPRDVKEGGTIFVKIDMVEPFFRDIHPLLPHPYILITHNGDDSAPMAFRPFLDDPKLIAWFTENPEGEPHPKLHPIPIGLANRCWAHGNPDWVQKAIDKNTPKRHLLYLNLTIQNYYAERWEVFQLFRGAPYCYRPAKKRFDSYLDDLAASQFILSPRGNGLDTHRLWESLYLRSYPIVKTSPLDPIYEGLPVVVIQDWTEVTERFLRQTYEEMSQKTYNYEKLTMAYWKKLIDSYKRNKSRSYTEM